jgi:hypothetical protein
MMQQLSEPETAALHLDKSVYLVALHGVLVGLRFETPQKCPELQNGLGGPCANAEATHNSSMYHSADLLRAYTYSGVWTVDSGTC